MGFFTSFLRPSRCRKAGRRGGAHASVVVVVVVNDKLSKDVESKTAIALDDILMVNVCIGLYLFCFVLFLSEFGFGGRFRVASGWLQRVGQR